MSQPISRVSNAAFVQTTRCDPTTATATTSTGTPAGLDFGLPDVFPAQSTDFGSGLGLDDGLGDFQQSDIQELEAALNQVMTALMARA